MEILGKVLKLKNSDAMSVHHTTQYRKLRQDVTDDERDDDEDDVVFLRRGIELKQQNGYDMDHVKFGSDSDPDLKSSRKMKQSSDNIQVKQSIQRKRMRKRPPFLLLTLVIALVTVSALVVVAMHRSKSKMTRSWIQEFLESEATSNLVLYDVNHDNINDIIISIITGNNMSITHLITRTSSQTDYNLCTLKENKSPCMGRILCMKGDDGEILWETMTPYGLRDIKCGKVDLDRDDSNDCIASGPFGGLVAFCPKTGHVIWSCNSSQLERNWLVVGVEVLADLNDDGVVDLVAMQTIQEELLNNTEHQSLLLLVDGATGNILGQPIRLRGESKFPPIVHRFKDQSLYIIYGTGTPVRNGSLYATSMTNLYSLVMSSSMTIKKPQVTSTFVASYKHFTGFEEKAGVLNLMGSNHRHGVIVPPLFLDVDQDGGEDMLVASCDGGITLFHGATNSILWSLSFSEHYVTRQMIPGYFNEDIYPDIFAYLNLKPHSNVTSPSSVVAVLSGVTGAIIWSANDTAVNFEATNLRSSTSNDGRDFFMFWLKRQKFQDGGSVKRDKRHTRDSEYPTSRRSRVVPRSRGQPPPPPPSPYDDYLSYANRRPHLFSGGNIYNPLEGDYRSVSDYGVEPDQTLPSKSRPYPPEYYNGQSDETDYYRGEPILRNHLKSNTVPPPKTTIATTTTSNPPSLQSPRKCRPFTEGSILVGVDRWSTGNPFVLFDQEAPPEMGGVNNSSNALRSNEGTSTHWCLSAIIQSTYSVIGNVDGDRDLDIVMATTFAKVEQRDDRSMKSTSKRLQLTKTNLQLKLSEIIKSRLELVTSPFLHPPSPRDTQPLLKASRTMSETDLGRYSGFELRENKLVEEEH